MSDCIFCKLANKEIPTDMVYEDDFVIAFNDMDPQAPFHVLVVPKKHISSFNHINPEEDAKTLTSLVTAAQTIAKKLGIAEDGYRLVINCGELGGQSVGHLHIHLLGGRQMTWPAG